MYTFLLTFDHISRACTDMHTLFKFLSCIIFCNFLLNENQRLGCVVRMKKKWDFSTSILMISLQDFKSQLARFAPRFVGYAQQDAEEFLYYLIKGLHEDVNLIRKKPSPFRFDEKAWDRMRYICILRYLFIIFTVCM